MHIATRFNRQSSELKFDLDILMLIAPAVVAFFDKDIPSQEILAVLPSYFEEHKLDEFETFLNQVPGQKNDQDADINWEPIHEPLEVVASAVGSQRYLWSQGFSKIYDQYSLAPPSGMPSPDRGHSPVASPHPLFLAPMHADDLKTFDIVVSPDETGQTVSPVRVHSPSAPSPGKSGMKPFIPVIAGVAVIRHNNFCGNLFFRLPESSRYNKYFEFNKSAHRKINDSKTCYYHVPTPKPTTTIPTRLRSRHQKVIPLQRSATIFLRLDLVLTMMS